MTAPIILPIDFSDHSAAALPWALKMSASLDCPLHCVYVVRDVALYSGMEFVPNAMPPIAELKQQAQQEMDKFKAEHKLGSEIVTAILAGTPFVEIIRYARAEDAQMIVMSTHGYSGLKHVLLGSTTEAVVRKASCPVLSIPAAGVDFEMP